MAKYIINENEDNRGYHEVHNEDTCAHLPYKWNRKPVGNFAGCFSAVSAAKEQNPHWKIDGCMHCSEACHNY